MPFIFVCSEGNKEARVVGRDGGRAIKHRSDTISQQSGYYRLDDPLQCQVVKHERRQLYKTVLNIHAQSPALSEH